LSQVIDLGYACSRLAHSHMIFPTAASARSGYALIESSCNAQSWICVGAKIG
jgi:hypothetical protein